MTALSILSTLEAELGDLDRINRIVKVFGMVNVAPGFNQTPAVIDGCSDVLVDISEIEAVTLEALLASPSCPSTSLSKSN